MGRLQYVQVRREQYISLYLYFVDVQLNSKYVVGFSPLHMDIYHVNWHSEIHPCIFPKYLVLEVWWPSDYSQDQLVNHCSRKLTAKMLARWVHYCITALQTYFDFIPFAIYSPLPFCTTMGLGWFYMSMNVTDNKWSVLKSTKFCAGEHKIIKADPLTCKTI